jgi:hypothetical protein
MKPRMLAAGLIAVVALLMLAASASAAGRTAVVTVASDAPGLTPPNCSLRDAITAVTNDATAGGCTVTGTGGDDHINFAPGMTGQTISLSFGELQVNDTDDLFITGPGMNQLTVTAHDVSRVFHLQTPTTLEGMSLVHGEAPEASGVAEGGAIESSAGGPFALTLNDVKVASSAVTATGTASTEFADGGGIHAQGVLRVNQSVVTGNSATATQTGMSTNDAEARGAAIFAQDDLVLTDSTISGNQASSTTNGTGASQATGAIRDDGVLEMSGSTVSGNVANATATTGNARARGGVHTNSTSGLNVIQQSTIAGNKADATTTGSLLRAGGLALGSDTNILSSTIALNGPDTATGVDGANIVVEGGVSEMLNTIVADPRGGGMNCVGTFTSDGFNDDFSPAGASCLDTPLTTDLSSNPLLAAAGLAGNGGLTETIALQPTSPMIDAGSNANLDDPNQDQRGASFIRPVDFSGLPNADNGTDIGAFEVQQACAGFTQTTPSQACPSPPGPPAPQPTTPAPKKKCKKKAKKGASSAKKKKCKKKKK